MKIVVLDGQAIAKIINRAKLPKIQRKPFENVHYDMLMAVFITVFTFIYF